MFYVCVPLPLPLALALAGPFSVICFADLMKLLWLFFAENERQKKEREEWWVTI
jgi:hypothetical protein